MFYPNSQVFLVLFIVFLSLYCILSGICIFFFLVIGFFHLLHRNEINLITIFLCFTIPFVLNPPLFFVLLLPSLCIFRVFEEKMDCAKDDCYECSRKRPPANWQEYILNNRFIVPHLRIL